MENLKKKLTENPRLKCGVGLKSADAEELEGMKQWLWQRGIPFVHKTKHLKTGKPLPYKGILLINLIGTKKNV